jgi:hypothetical protein
VEQIPVVFVTPWANMGLGGQEIEIFQWLF